MSLHVALISPEVIIGIAFGIAMFLLALLSLWQGHQARRLLLRTATTLNIIAVYNSFGTISWNRRRPGPPHIFTRGYTRHALLSLESGTITSMPVINVELA